MAARGVARAAARALVLAGALALGACEDTVVVGERVPFSRPAAGALFGVVEAEDYVAKAGVAAVREHGLSSAGRHVAADAGDALTYTGLDFGAGATAVQVRLASATDGATIELRLGAADGPRIGEAPIPNTGGWALHQEVPWSTRYRTVTVPVTGARGAHALVVLIRGAAGHVVDVDFLRPLGAHRAVTWVVSPTGDDAGRGGAEAPLRTFAAAVERLRPGDTLQIQPGTYAERLVLPASASGTPAARVSIRGGAGVIVDGAGLVLGSAAALVDLRADHVTLADVEVRNAVWPDGRGIQGYGDFLRIERCKVHTTQEAGIALIDAANAAIVGNEVWDTGRLNLPVGSRTEVGGWPGAISLLNPTDAVVEGNLVHDNHGDGIKVSKDAYRVRVARNVVRDSWSMNVFLDNAHDSVVEQNLSYSTAKTYIAKGSGDPTWPIIPTAFGVGDFNWSTPDGTWACGKGLVPGARNVFQNNVAVNTRSGFAFAERFVPCSGLKETKVVNNTFVEQWDEAIVVASTGSTSEHVGSVFQNNVVHGRRAVPVLVVGSRNDTRLERNLFFRSEGRGGPFVWTASRLEGAMPMELAELEASTTRARGNVWASPGLVGQGRLDGDVAKHHQLGAGSPAVDRGMAEGAPKLDFFGNARPAGSAIDLGAHELGARR